MILIVRMRELRYREFMTFAKVPPLVSDRVRAKTQGPEQTAQIPQKSPGDPGNPGEPLLDISTYNHPFFLCLTHLRVQCSCPHILKGRGRCVFLKPKKPNATA